MALGEIRRGPTAETVSINLQRLTKARGLTTATLSERLRRLGRPILPTGITKIIKGGRRVDVDDLMALAIALEVNPNALLLPSSARRDYRFDVTGAEALPPGTLWDWAEGKEPLFVPEDDDGETYQDFQTHARPRGRRAYRSFAALRAAERGARLATEFEAAELGARLATDEELNREAEAELHREHQAEERDRRLEEEAQAEGPVRLMTKHEREQQARQWDAEHPPRRVTVDELRRDRKKSSLQPEQDEEK